MISQFLHIFIDPRTLITTLGTLGVIAVIFMETGLFFGFFFPGDSLLFLSGFFASLHYLPLAWLMVGTFIAAVLGDSLGYAIGRKIGPALFTKEDSIFFSRKHISRAEHFYEKHGKKTIILARFIPIIRTFAPVVAGIGSMRYKTFLAYNVIGGLAWTWALLLFGFGFGSLIPDPDRYVLPTVLVIILISASPALWEIYKGWRRKGQDLI